MTLSVEDQIFAVWLPAAVAVIFMLVGVWRGALREAVVSMAVVLGAFVNNQWAGRWAEETFGVYKGVDQQRQQFIISMLVLWLVILVVGYGLGSLLPREPLKGASRAVGALLGLASGAAAAGWSLRYFITNPDGTLASPSPLIDDLTSRIFMIWAGWFPLALALLATIAVIAGPLSRARGRVAQPVASSDWQPGPQAAPSPAVAPANVPDYSAYSTPAPEPRPAVAGNTMPTAQLPASETQVITAANTTQIGTQPDAGTYSLEQKGSDPSWLYPPEKAVDGGESAPAASTEAVGGAAVYGKESAPVYTPGSWSQVVKSEGKCPNCGEPLTPGASFCTQCGTRVAP